MSQVSPLWTHYIYLEFWTLDKVHEPIDSDNYLAGLLIDFFWQSSLMH
jgi:hypothetical protein